GKRLMTPDERTHPVRSGRLTTANIVFLIANLLAACLLGGALLSVGRAHLAPGTHAVEAERAEEKSPSPLPAGPEAGQKIAARRPPASRAVSRAGFPAAPPLVVHAPPPVLHTQPAAPQPSPPQPAPPPDAPPIPEEPDSDRRPPVLVSLRFDPPGIADGNVT